jgi:hypothetical protein
VQRPRAWRRMKGGRLIAGSGSIVEKVLDYMEVEWRDVCFEGLGMDERRGDKELVDKILKFRGSSAENGG